MRATEIIRDVLNIIDRVESDENHSEPRITITHAKVDSDNNTIPLGADPASEINRYMQIVDLLPDENDTLAPFSNTPVPKVSDISAVIMSGDDVNKSKHPSDLRSDSVSLYPNFQAKE